MSQGPCCRLTAEQIATVRAAQSNYVAAKRRRSELCHKYGIDKRYFFLIGTGARGKKPRPVSGSKA